MVNGTGVLFGLDESVIRMPLVFGFEKLQIERRDASTRAHRRALKRNGFLCGGLWLGYGGAMTIRGGSRRLKLQDEMRMNKDFGRAGPTLSGIQFPRYRG